MNVLVGKTHPSSWYSQSNHTAQHLDSLEQVYEMVVYNSLVLFHW